MRSWKLRLSLSLLALTIGFTPQAWAGSLNDIFTFPHITYTQGPAAGEITGNRAGGEFLGMGDVTIFFHYLPDPEGGHPTGRTIRFDGVIPELGIIEESLLYAGVILDDPEEFPGPPGPGFLRFEIAHDESHPALGFSGVDTWDIRLPLRVPAPAAGLLLGAGVLLLVMRMRRLI